MIYHDKIRNEKFAVLFAVSFHGPIFRPGHIMSFETYVDKMIGTPNSSKLVTHHS